jgi:hypothetical protein
MDRTVAPTEQKRTAHRGLRTGCALRRDSDSLDDVRLEPSREVVAFQFA